MLVEPETMTPAAGSTAASPKGMSAARTETIRGALRDRLVELRGEHDAVLAGLEAHGGVDAGDDVADLGTKAFAREQEMVMVSGIQARMEQVERALEQLARGRYGWCERCAEEIPVARLAAFPAATQCVRCKRLEERR
jgi:RNA polymerase-binding transcription factor